MRAVDFDDGSVVHDWDFLFRGAGLQEVFRAIKIQWPSHLEKPLWRNWQTRWTQNPVSSEVSVRPRPEASLNRRDF